MFVFYAYWNGSAVRDLFEALVRITHDAGFVQLAATVLLAGLLVAMAAAATRSQGKGVISYFAAAVLLWSIALGPKVTVVIEDVRSQAVWTVDHVPLGLAVPGSFANRIGHWLAQSYETAFAPVDVARFSRFGAVYPERVLTVLEGLGPVTAAGKAGLDAFVQACVLPELLTDAGKLAAVTSSVDLWATVSQAGWVNPARLAPMPDGVTDCARAVNQVQRLLDDVELPALKSVLGARLAADHIDPDGVIARAVPQSQALLLGLSRTLEASLRHAVLRHTVPQQVHEQALGMAVNLAQAQGNLAGEINSRTMAKMAEDALPKIRNAIEFVVLALFPVVLLVALVSGRNMGVILKSFVTLLLTVQVWPAAASVVNYLIITADMHPFSRIAAQFGGDTLQAAALIRQTGTSSQAIAGALMCAVPVMAYALVRAGDVAVGQLVAGLTGPAQSAASAQGAALAAGNVSLGNVAMRNVSAHNVSAHKSDASVRATDDRTVVTQSAYGTVTRAADGTVTGLSRTAVDMGVSAWQAQSFVRAHNASHMAQVTSLWSHASRFSFAQAAASSEGTQRQFAQALREALAKDRMLAQSDERSTGWSQTQGHGYTAEVTDSHSVSEAMRYQSQARLSASVGAGAGKLGAQSTQRAAPAGGLSGALSMDEAQTVLDTATGRTQATSQASRQDAMRAVQTAAERVSRTHNDESVRSAARHFASSLSATHTAARDSSQARIDSQTAASGLSEVRNATMAAQVDQATTLMQSAVARHGSAEAALKALFSAQARQRAASELYHSPHTEAFGPGTMQSALGLSAEADTQAEAAVRRHARSAQRAVRDHAPASTSVTAPDTQTFEASFAEQRQALQADHVQATSDIDRERGLIVVAREAYKREHRDKNFVLRNAFLGAWGYRSGEELYTALRKRADADPKLQETLREIGRQEKLQPQHWERLKQWGSKP